MKILFLIVLMLNPLFAAVIHAPSAIFQADGGVTDIVYHDSKLYAATSAGTVDIFNVKNHKKIKTISVPKIKNFLGTPIHAKIYSVDIVDKKILLLAQASSGYREVYIYENSKLTKIIDAEKKLAIAKAKFLNSNTIVLALLGNDLISYDINKKMKNWTQSVSQSKFSNFALNEDKSKIVVADESGDLQVLSTKDAKHLKTLSGQNLDNVFAVDFKNGVIATAGQDRRAVIYDLAFNSAYYEKSSFLIYGVGLSPSAKLAAYSSNEQNDVTLFKTSTQSKLGVYGEIKMTLTKILFISETEFFVASDDKNINLYTIK
jgi:hypothetical protein